MTVLVTGATGRIGRHLVDALVEKGEKVGLIKVRLYRPFSIKHLINALPKTVKKISVLDRTKEPGAAGEPLYIDVVNAITQSYNDGTLHLESFPKITGGRYGLSSKEFAPSMVISIFDEMKKDRPKNNFTAGIIDDVTNTSLPFDPKLSIEPDETFRGKFYGLGADGTV